MPTTQVDMDMLHPEVFTQVQGMIGTAVPLGVVAPYALPVAPAGWLLCDGSALAPGVADDLRSALIAASSPFGASGADPRLPDLRGRISAGLDNMGGVAANRLTAAGLGVAATALGAAGGGETHVLTTPQMPAHTHVINTAFPLIEGAGWSTVGSGSTGITRGSQNTQSAGTGQAHPNVQPTIAMNYIIKATAG